jgi:hypothetical protein
MAAKVLIVLLAETRAHELTFDLFKKNLMGPLNADLALCVGDNPRETPNDFYSLAKYVWKFKEPNDWAIAFDEYAGGANWRCLLEVRDQWLGGVKHPTLQHPGSAGLLLIFREFLKRKIKEENILQEYDWIVITRSDFMWPIAHPGIELFSPNFIYFPDGERYGGFTDRHVMVPRGLFERFTDLTKPVFEEPEALALRMKAFGKSDWNLETFIKFRLDELGLLTKIRFMPYLMYSIRAQDAATRWSAGNYSPEHRFNIKYESEYFTSRAVQCVVFESEDWKHMIGAKRFLNWRIYVFSWLRAVREKHRFSKRLRFLRLARRALVFARQPI